MEDFYGCPVDFYGDFYGFPKMTMETPPLKTLTLPNRSRWTALEHAGTGICRHSRLGKCGF